MTVDTGSLTMAEYAQMSNNPLIEAVTMSLIDNGSVMARDIPFTTKQTMVVNGSRVEGNLPTVNWTQINAEPVASVGVPTPYQEVAYIIRESIDVDKNLVADINRVTDPRELQVQLHMKAIAYDFNDKFINNDHVAGDANAIVGLKYRIANGSTYGVRTENLIDGGGVDITLGTLTTASTKDSGNKLLELLDTALERVDSGNGGSNVVLYMNEVTKRRIRTALHALGTDGGLNVSQDQFGRMIDTYRGCPLMNIGRKADQTTYIIPGNGLTSTSAIGETAAGVSSTGASALYTSIYAVNFGAGHFHGWQFEPLQARDLGLLNNGVIYRTVVDWTGGLINDSNRSICRIYDIKTGG